MVVGGLDVDEAPLSDIPIFFVGIATHLKLKNAGK